MPISEQKAFIATSNQRHVVYSISSTTMAETMHKCAPAWFLWVYSKYNLYVFNVSLQHYLIRSHGAYMLRIRRQCIRNYCLESGPSPMCTVVHVRFLYKIWNYKSCWCTEDDALLHAMIRRLNPFVSPCFCFDSHEIVLWSGRMQQSPLYFRLPHQLEAWTDEHKKVGPFLYFWMDSGNSCDISNSRI